MLYSNTSGYVSYQTKSKGGCLIDAFCKIMKNEVMNGKRQRHLHEIIVDIRQQVKQNSGIIKGNNNGDITQLLAFHDTLEWYIYFGINKLGNKMDAAKQEHKKLRLQISSATENINYLKKQRDNIKKQVYCERKRLKALENASILAQEEAKTAETKARKCNQKVEDLEVVMAKNAVTIQFQERSIRTKEQALADVTQKYDEMYGEYETLEEETTQLEIQKENLGQEITSNRGENAMLKEKYKRELARYYNLVNINNEKKEEINKMEANKAALEKQVDKMRYEVMEKDEEIVRLNATSNALLLLSKQVEESTANANLQCSICDSSFGSRRELDRHKRKHNKEKPHSCPLCLKRFAELGECRRHLVVCAEKAKMNNGGYYCDCGQVLVKCAARRVYGSPSSVKCHSCCKIVRGDTTIYYCKKGCCDDHGKRCNKCVTCVRRMLK